MPSVAVILPAAGKSSRFGGKEKKPFVSLDGRPVWQRSAELFWTRDDVTKVYLVISPVTYFIVPSEVRYMYEDLDGGTSPVRGITGLWILLPLLGSIIWFVKVQGALNRYWQSKGVAPA